MTALEMEIIVVLNGSSEKCLARIARQSAEMITFGDVTANAAVFDSTIPSAGRCVAIQDYRRRWIVTKIGVIWRVTAAAVTVKPLHHALIKIYTATTVNITKDFFSIQCKGGNAVDIKVDQTLADPSYKLATGSQKNVARKQQQQESRFSFLFLWWGTRRTKTRVVNFIGYAFRLVLPYSSFD